MAAPQGVVHPLAAGPVAANRTLNTPGFSGIMGDMGKTKIPATGEGYLGELMVHKLTRAAGVVDSVSLAREGWAPQITLKLPDGTVKKGRLSDFRDPSGNERAKFSAV